jgi:hypothetical protein
MDYSNAISTLAYKLTFGVAHPGQSFEVVNTAHWEFDFFKVTSHAGYIEKLTPASYLLSFS